MADAGELVTEDVVRRALARWVAESRETMIYPDLVYSWCYRDSAVYAHMRTTQDFKRAKGAAARLLKQLEGQTIETPDGPYTLLRHKWGSRVVWALLRGAYTPEEQEERDQVRAWFVDVGNTEMKVATAHGKGEARRLASAELERRGVKPEWYVWHIKRERYSDWSAWARGEGAVWGFWE